MRKPLTPPSPLGRGRGEGPNLLRIECCGCEFMSAGKNSESLMKPGERTVDPQERARQRILWSVLILVLVGVSGVGVRSLLREQPATRATPSGASVRLPVYGSVPDFSLLERSGGQVQLSDLRDKIWIANFIFTNCPDECPLMTGEMAQLQTDFSSTGIIRFVSITVDPERDTPAVLSRYADRFGADPERWLFLTGGKAAIYRLAREGFRVSVIDPIEESGLFVPPLALAHHGREQDPAHSASFVLVDRRARIRGYYDGRDTEALRRLRQHVNTLLREE